MNNWKKKAALLMAMGIAATSLAGCGTEVVSIGRDTTNPTISIMTQQNNISSADQNSPVVQDIETNLGEKMSEKYNKNYEKVTLDFNWVSSSSYGEKVTAAMGANEYPHVMLVTSRTSSVIQNSKIGTFWDLTDKFEEKNEDGSLRYPNLAQANKDIIRNTTVDGKLYGVYRARVIGRQGMTFRKDWVKNLYDKGKLSFSDYPKTIDDLNEMVKAFTEDDPDGNGVNDTYGMIITSYMDGPIYNLAVWCGSPNEWGYDEKTEQWKPWFMSEGYFEALKLVREWYAKGYVNQNMVSLDSNKWDTDFLTGVGGIQLDVADRARRNAAKMEDPDSVDVIGYVKKDKDSKPAIWPTTGYNGYYVIPQVSVPNEEDMEFILSVLDECNSDYIVGLCNYGIEGRHYDLNDEGKVVQRKEEGGKNNLYASEYADLNQFSMGLVPEHEGSLKSVFATPAAEKVDKVQKDNEQYAVNNPMAPYTSESYATSGTMMDSIINEARTNYLVGKIDEDGYKDAINQWLKMDGDKVMKEYGEAYANDDQNKDANGNVVIPDEYKFDFKF